MRPWIAGALILVSTAAPVWSASISLFSDTDCTSCNLSVPVGETGRFYALAQPQQFEPERPYGAEFRIAGLPAGWEVVAVQPNPVAHVVLGNPLGLGTNIAFPGGQPGSCLLLFAMDIRATSVVTNARLR